MDNILNLVDLKMHYFSGDKFETTSDYADK